VSSLTVGIHPGIDTDEAGPVSRESRPPWGPTSWIGHAARGVAAFARTPVLPSIGNPTVGMSAGRSRCYRRVSEALW
jgi:hypothetical protein